jgi:hypothetical protein
MLKRTFLALSVVALTVTGIAQAQENATLVLRSGERISGQLEDMGGVGFTVKVNGVERQIPTNDVAVIDFGAGDMSSADWEKISGGNHMVWLKNGQTVEGSLYDIGGSSPLRITFKTTSGDREFSSSEIARIVLARPNNASGVAATTGSAPGTAITVSGRQQWTATGMYVQRGQVVTLHTTGEIQLSGDPNDMATADGAKAQRYASRSPLPRNLAGALIGRIGNGRPFGIGTQTSITMPASGQLFLGVNDDSFNDNQGEFRVELQTTGAAGTAVPRR